MIYLFFEIANYKQLSMINTELIDIMEDKIMSVVKLNDLSLVQKKKGIFLFSCGDEEKRNPEEVLEAAFDFFSIFENNRKELFGFNLLISIETENSSASVCNSMQNILLHILEDEGIWIHQDHWGQFKKHAVGDQKNDFVRIVKKAKAEPVYKTISQISQTRKKVLRRLSNVFLGWVTHEKAALSSIHIRGPRGVCKEEIVLHVVNTVFGHDRLIFLPTIDFRKKDDYGLQPFAASVPEPKEIMKKTAGNYLSLSEKRVWKAKYSLLENILDKKKVFADNIQRDFLLCYSLFILSFARMLKQKLLPCVVVLLFPEHAQKKILEIFIHALKDLSQEYPIHVISVSHVDEPQEALRSITKKRVMVNPFKKEEIFHCFTALYPKIKVPAGVVDQIFRLSKGIYRNILFYIYYLRMQNKIEEHDEVYVWVDKTERTVKIPQNPWLAGSALIKSLKDEAKMLLFVNHWMDSIFIEADIREFFRIMGLSADSKETHYKYLQSLQLIPAFPAPAFRKAVLHLLHSISASKTAYIKEQIHKMLVSGIEHYVPRAPLKVLEILAGQEDYSMIIRVLPIALHTAIDENKFTLVESLLKYCKSILSANKKNLKNEQEKEIKVIHAAFKIKLLVATGDLPEAGKFIKRFLPDTESLSPHIPYAHLYLALGSYYCSSRDLESAVDNSKKAMHFFQELDLPENTAESFLELAIEFLGRGNVRETLDYFTFAQKLSYDQGVLPVYIRSLLFESSAFYLTGNYSRIKANCAKGIDSCEKAGMREYQLLFYFIEGRVQFDLGLYEKALELFEKALELTTLYKNLGPRDTLYAWIARTAVYQKKRAYAFKLLAQLPETPETLFFLSEALYFEDNYHKAVTCLTKALQMKNEPETLYSRYVSWTNGFSFLEGRCFDLTANGTPLARLIRMFRAFNLYKAGSVKEGIGELHEIAINQKFSAAEPHEYFFYFFYYKILKSVENPRALYQESAHGLTILNKALKHLQERSTTIDEPRDRINYLTKNYWNTLLMEEAKANKLL